MLIEKIRNTIKFSNGNIIKYSRTDTFNVTIIDDYIKVFDTAVGEEIMNERWQNIRYKTNGNEISFTSQENAARIVDEIFHSIGVTIDRYFARYTHLSTDPNIKNAVGNYSGAPVKFIIAPGIDEHIDISRLLVTISDNGAFDSGGYGGPALTNGIQILLTRDNGNEIITDLLDGINIKTLGDWVRTNHDLDIYNFGAGDSYLNIRWSLYRAGQLLRLSGARQERLEIILNDDFSSLSTQYFNLQGILV